MTEIKDGTKRKKRERKNFEVVLSVVGWGVSGGGAEKS